MRLHHWISALALAALTLPAWAQVGGGTLGGGTTPGTIGGGPGIGSGTTGIAIAIGRKRRFPSPKAPGLYELRLPNTATGFIERFLLQIPTVYSPGPVPLLVAFHRFGNSMYDIPINTDLCAEAEARGWYLLAPMSLTDEHLNSVASQLNTEQALNIITRIYNIDDDRIYGIGHSMGGGIALSYAARHLDPEKPMFAALINHTGVMSQAHSYEHVCYTPPNLPKCGRSITQQDDWDFWYGGSPTTNAFDYQRSSLIEISYEVGFPSIPSVDQQTDMARNLTHIPMQSWMVNFDPLQELVLQNFAFRQQMVLRGGNHTLSTAPLNQHLWSTLDQTAALDFMSLQTLTLPTSAETLADRNGVYFHFEVTQTVGMAFSPFTWSVDSLLNSVSITETANLSILDVDMIGAGLTSAPGDVLTVDLSAADDLPALIRLNGVMNAPVSVMRDGMAQRSWSYDSIENSLSLQDANGDLHQWVFTF